MIEKKGTIKNIFIVVILVAVLFVAYVMFVKDAPEKAELVVVSGEGVSDTPHAAREFLQILDDLGKIKLNTDVFAEETYQRLHDFSVLLVPESRGRSNPFAPFGAAASLATPPSGGSSLGAPTSGSGSNVIQQLNL